MSLLKFYCLDHVNLTAWTMHTLLDIDGLEVPEIWVLMCNKASDHELSRKTCKRQSYDTA